MVARALLPLLCLASAHAFQLAPVLKPRGAASRLPHIVAQAPEPAPTRTGSIVAGTYTGIMQITFAAACASIIFGPVGLPISIGIQHALVGFVITQVVTKNEHFTPSERYEHPFSYFITK